MPAFQDEKDIRLALRNGSEAAFSRIFSIYKEEVYHFIFDRTNSTDLADEIFQVVFVKLWENRANIDVEKPISPYIFQISKNEVYSYWRQHFKTLQLLNCLELEDPKQPDEPLLDDEAASLFSSMLDKLPEKKREVFQLRYMYSLSYKDISDKLGLSVKTVEYHLSTGISYLRKALKKRSFLFFF